MSPNLAVTGLPLGRALSEVILPHVRCYALYRRRARTQRPATTPSSGSPDDEMTEPLSIFPSNADAEAAEEVPTDELGELWRNRSMHFPLPAGALHAQPRQTGAQRAASAFIRTRPPRLLYSAAVMADHALNASAPEVCVLGCSNVGKSSLINGLLGTPGLARSSRTPGLTRTVNAYAVGGAREARSSAGPLVLLDTPGYGFRSRAEWGVHLARYLERRRMLRAAVLLLRGGADEGAPTAADADALRLLAARQVPVLLVLTRADRALAGWRDGVAAVAARVAALLPDVRFDTPPHRLWITAAGMRTNPRAGRAVTGAGGGEVADHAGLPALRLAILRAASVADFGVGRRWGWREFGGGAGLEDDDEIVPYDQITWREGSSEQLNEG